MEVRDDIARISIHMIEQHSVTNHGESKMPTNRNNRPNVFDNSSKKEGELRETKSKTSFRELNISPIHNNSKSSIFQDNKGKSCNY